MHSPFPSVAQIDAIVTAGAARFVSDQALTQAIFTLTAAIDPDWLCDEGTTLHAAVDRHGFSSARIKQLETLVLEEIALRQGVDDPVIEFSELQ